jgi:hypothetical protein
MGETGIGGSHPIRKTDVRRIRPWGLDDFNAKYRLKVAPGSRLLTKQGASGSRLRIT